MPPYLKSKGATAPLAPLLLTPALLLSLLSVPNRVYISTCICVLLTVFLISLAWLRFKIFSCAHDFVVIKGPLYTTYLNYTTWDRLLVCLYHYTGMLLINSLIWKIMMMDLLAIPSKFNWITTCHKYNLQNPVSRYIKTTLMPRVDVTIE